MRYVHPMLALGLALAAVASQAQIKPSSRFSGPSLLPPARAAGAPTSAPAALSAPTTPPAAPSAPAARNENADREKAGQNAAHGWLLLLDRKDWGTAWDASS